jgi:hypothetical protein
MSLILDALNKSERENKGTIPDLTTLHSPAPSKTKQQPWAIIGLTAICSALLALLIATWISRPKTPEPAATSTQPVVTAPPQTAPPTEPIPEPITYNPQVVDASPQLETLPSLGSTPASVRTGSQRQLPIPIPPPNTPDYLVELPDVVDASGRISAATLQDLGSDVRTLYQPQQDAQVTEVVDIPVQAVPAEPQVSSVDQALARELWEKSKIQPIPESLLAKTRAPATPKTAKPEPKPTAEILDAPVSDTLAAYPDTPYLHELPVTEQHKIPTLMYAKHDYRKGVVYINKTELRLGDKTEGVILERVLADGVLMNAKGVNFKLAAQSSWVNY